MSLLTQPIIDITAVQRILEPVNDNKSALLSLKSFILPVLNDAIINCSKETLLIWATRSYFPVIVEVLIELGASVDICDSSKNTALIWAVFKNNEKIADLLLKADANINKQDNSNRTALHWAGIRCNMSIVEKLLSRGALFTLKDNEEKTAVDYVTKWTNDEQRTRILKLMENKPAKPIETAELKTETEDDLEEEDSDEEDSEDTIVDSLTNEQFIQVASLIKSFGVKFSVVDGKMKI